ncbi:MAG TPA: Zn-ribbon containing protein [Candidatus Thermoplasmatota archaeon]|nr:Zn-ribbon containing protein [Candidatus Thermoplasmatota archaeon]
MAHQCLQCGKLYEAGSKDLLKGCQSCGGTRFFFTKEKISDDARASLMQKADRDLRSVVAELVAGGQKPDYDDPLWSRERWAQWVKVDKSGRLPTVAEYVTDVDKELSQAQAAAAPEAPAKPRVSIHAIADTVRETGNASALPGIADTVRETGNASAVKSDQLPSPPAAKAIDRT